MDVRVGPKRQLSTEELMLFNCDAGEDSWDKPVNPKGNQSWIFIRRTDAEAESPMLWPPDAKSQLNGKNSDVGKDWGQEEKGTTEDEIVGWHHWLNGYVFEEALGDSEEIGNLACCSPWGHKQSDRTAWLYNNMYLTGVRLSEGACVYRVWPVHAAQGWGISDNSRRNEGTGGKI